MWVVRRLTAAASCVREVEAESTSREMQLNVILRWPISRSSNQSEQSRAKQPAMTENGDLICIRKRADTSMNRPVVIVPMPSCVWMPPSFKVQTLHRRVHSCACAVPLAVGCGSVIFVSSSLSLCLCGQTGLWRTGLSADEEGKWVVVETVSWAGNYGDDLKQLLWTQSAHAHTHTNTHNSCNFNNFYWRNND